MKYHYAIIDDIGKCYGIRNTPVHICDPHYIPIYDNFNKYLSKYYWPILPFTDCHDDFSGEWYLDASHTIKEVALNVY